MGLLEKRQVQRQVVSIDKWGYQSQLADDSVSLLESGSNPIIVAPTGSGKTRIAHGISQRLISLGYTPIFVVDRVDLVNQTALRWSELEGFTVGKIIAGSSIDTQAEAFVASAQTMQARKDKLQPIYNMDKDVNFLKFRKCVIIMDECHTTDNQRSRDIRAWFRDAEYGEKPREIGLTATPVGDMKRYYDVMIFGPSYKDLISRGILCPVKFRSGNPLTSARMKYLMQHKFSDKSEQEVMKDIIRDGSYIKEFDEHGGRGAFFTGSKRFSKEIQNRLIKETGKNAIHVDGTVPMWWRTILYESIGKGYELSPTQLNMFLQYCKEYVDDMELDWSPNQLADLILDGRVDAIINLKIIVKGTDIPELTWAAMLQPWNQYHLWVQGGGRVMRVAEGKELAYINDYADCAWIAPGHANFVEDPMPWSLQDFEVPKRGKYEERKADYKICSECNEIRKRGTGPCECGHVPEIRQSSSTIEERVAGLTEVKSKKDRVLEHIPTMRSMYRKMIWLSKEYFGREDLADKLWKYSMPVDLPDIVKEGAKPIKPDKKDPIWLLTKQARKTINIRRSYAKAQNNPRRKRKR